MRAGRVIAGAMLALASLSASATPAQDGLATFLEKKYGKHHGLLAILDKVTPNTPTGTGASYEGSKADGSYYRSAYFNAMNVSQIGQPYRTLQKYCSESGGTFNQAHAVRVFDNGERLQAARLVDPAGGADLAIDGQMLERWRYDRPPKNPVRVPRQWSGRSAAALIDNRNQLGLFTCAHGGGGLPLWHVAIMPTRFGNMDALEQVGRTQNAWFMLAIRPITRAIIDATLAEFKASQDARRARAAEVEVEGQKNHNSQSVTSTSPFWARSKAS